LATGSAATAISATATGAATLAAAAAALEVLGHSSAFIGQAELVLPFAKTPIDHPLRKGVSDLRVGWVVAVR
jgi:hypothetical protein